MAGNTTTAHTQNLKFLADYLKPNQMQSQLLHNTQLLRVLESMSTPPLLFKNAEDDDEKLRWALYALACLSQPAVQVHMCHTFDTAATCSQPIPAAALLMRPQDLQYVDNGRQDDHDPEPYNQLLLALKQQASSDGKAEMANRWHQQYLNQQKFPLEVDMTEFSHVPESQPQIPASAQDPFTLPSDITANAPCKWYQFQLGSIYRIIVLRPAVFWALLDALHLLPPLAHIPNPKSTKNGGFFRIDKVGNHHQAGSESQWQWTQTVYTKQDATETAWLHHDTAISDPALAMKGDKGFAFERRLQLSQPDSIRIHDLCAYYIQQKTWRPNIQTDLPYIQHALLPSADTISDCHMLFYLCIEQYIAQFNIANMTRDTFSQRPLCLPMTTSITQFRDAFPYFFRRNAYDMQLNVPPHLNTTSNPSINFNWHCIPPLVLSTSSTLGGSQQTYFLWELLNPAPASNPLNITAVSPIFLHIDPFKDAPTQNPADAWGDINGLKRIFIRNVTSI